MATGQIQSKETLLAAFSEGKFPTAQNWADLIESMYPRLTSFSTICHAEFNAYTNPWRDNNDGKGILWRGDYNYYGGDDYNLGGITAINDTNILSTDLSTPYSPITIEDIVALYNRKERDKEYLAGKLTDEDIANNSYGYIGTDNILLIHNDGAWYYSGNDHDGAMYIQWKPSGGGEYWNWYAIDERYYEWSQGSHQLTIKPQIVKLPVGCTVAFAATRGGWQPISNFIAYDYDTLMQQVQNYNN